MLSKQELLAMLVGLSSGSDMALLDDDRCLTSEVCVEADRATVREVALPVDKLLGGFSYTTSPEFARIVEGKSAAVVAMQRKLAEEPVKKAKERARFGEALTALLSSNEAYALLPETDHQSLDRIRHSVVRLHNPEH